MTRRLSGCPLPASTRSPLHHPVGAGHARPARFPPPPVTALHTPSHPYIVGRGLDPSAARRGRRPPTKMARNHPTPAHLPAGTRSPFRHPVGAGHARPATFPSPAVNLPPLTHSPKPPDPATLLPPTTPHNLYPSTTITPIYTLPKLHPQTLSKKSKKTCKNLLTKVILLAIIIKLSREPSPRRQPLEPLPTACTPFFEENFFKKLSENLLTNERI